MPSTHSSQDELEQPIDEIERYIHLKHRIKQLCIQYHIPNMAVNDSCPLKDYVVPSLDEPHSSIALIPIEANNLELKPSLLQIMKLNQFSGNPT